MKTLVLGATGFIGSHVRQRLVEQGEEVATFNPKRDSWDWLKLKLQECGRVIDCAGVSTNSTPVDFRKDLEFHQKVIGMLGDQEYIYASSTRVGDDSHYGSTKATIESWLNREQVCRLHNVFGPGCPAFKQSIIATWCTQLAKGISPSPAKSGLRNYMHVGSAVDILLDRQTGVVIKALVDIDLLRTLKEMAQGWVPDKASLIGDLYDTYQWYAGARVRTKSTFYDHRGELIEWAKMQPGQFNLVTIEPGETRGGHYHNRNTESFLLLDQQVVLKTRTYPHEVQNFQRLNDPIEVIVPPEHIHELTNHGSRTAVVGVWSRRCYNPGDKDTHEAKIVE